MFRHLTFRARAPAFGQNCLSWRRYSSVPKRNVRSPDQGPKLRYLFVVVLASYGLLHLVTQRMDKKKAPQTSFSEREFQEYEKRTGLRRRVKLIPPEKRDQYHFYAVPFTSSKSTLVESLDKLGQQGREIKVIDTEELMDKEVEQEGKYSFLIEDIRSSGRSVPKGLLTALVKNEVHLYMNTTKGQYDTDIVLVNYPQTTDEAIKFENDISDIHACLVPDNEDVLQNSLDHEKLRNVNNVVGYFDMVHKVQKFKQDK
ncbi:Altered inheritance of mitochondria protein 36, mitochondrial [Candidozyma auris]|uniref:Altered inheritance of mitochondria protein 36, mitochondrial n=2 Tax=Candidozyma auris TaxID=498019 RepID=A0A2H0ZTR9_CANAR|nr:hypothetical_protein [[Candida] auris]PIS52043.1 hypothetical protein B9J08_003654 [[Candida] auris]PIS54031.1 hypothetical protein CJI97_003729 [[Candida] auris]QEO21344.1 hypothetical_protein [[Candida] auris]QWW21645.1 hypothetical protein CA7LBN_000391 [[Candida] auris]GBL48150.1 hypothetical protein CAJCM15448_04240 [[Candida] auris]